MTKLNFSIQLRHSHQRGSADIVEDYLEGLEDAMDFFTSLHAESGESFEMKTNLIGNYEGYQVYENYTDSGSIDYYYFAIAE